VKDYNIMTVSVTRVMTQKIASDSCLVLDYMCALYIFVLYCVMTQEITPH